MGSPKQARPWPLDRMLVEHGDALYDFALAVTGDPERAAAAVREAVPGAVALYGPGVGRARLLGSVFAVAARDAAPPPPLSAEMVEPGPGSPDELQRLARAATRLLDPAQRGCLDLALRQGVAGEDLSEALGVAPGLASVSVQAAIDQAEHVIGAVLLARVARDDCPGLADVTLDAVGVSAEKLAAAVTEHGETCAACGDRRRALVPVTTLLAGVPAVPAPAGLKRPVDPRRRGAVVRALRPPNRPPLPEATARRRRWRGRRRLVAGLAAGLLVLALVAVVWPRRSGEIARTAAPGGRLAVDAAPVDFGPADTQRSLRITNEGRQPLVFQTRAAVPWLSFAGGDGTLDPGATAVVTAVLDRSRAPEGAAVAEIRVQSNGGSAAVPVRADVERVPELSNVEATPQAVVVRRCPGSTPALVRVSVVEESGLAAVELHWARPGKAELGRAEQISPMSTDGQSSYRGALGPFDTPGDVQWWVTAADIRNNRAASPPQVLRVGSC